MFWQEKSSKLIWIFALSWKFKQIYLNLCFDKGNQSDPRENFWRGQCDIRIVHRAEILQIFQLVFLKIDEFINPSYPSKNKLSSWIINNLPKIEIFSKEKRKTGTENWFEFCVLTSKIKSANMPKKSDIF